MSDTARLGLRRPAGGDDFLPTSDITENADLLDNAAIDLTGTFASRPPANSVERGTYYFSNDTGDQSRSDGTTWFTLTPANRSSFAALRNGSEANIAAGAVAKLTFASEVFDLGGNYDPATGRFTAPVKGVYEFSFSVGQPGTAMAAGTDPFQIDVRLYKGGAYVGLLAKDVLDENHRWELAGQFSQALDVGEYIELYLANGGSASTALHVAVMNSRFSGELKAQLP